MKWPSIMIGVVLVAADVTAARAQTMASAAALDRWVTAVREHKPGRSDKPAATIAALSYANRVALNQAMPLFLRGLQGKAVSKDSDAQRQIDALVHAVRFEPGAATFLRLAAILHTDAAVFRSDLPTPPVESTAPQQTTTAIDGRSGLAIARATVRPPPPPPLLSNDHFIVHGDGRMIGEAGADWNWPFARSLLDLLLEEDAHRRVDMHITPHDRVFIAEWYHAIAAYLLAVGDEGDLNAHQQHAAAILSDDPNVLFDGACNAEILGLPYHQLLRDDPVFQAAAARLKVVLPVRDQTNADAERLFRRAIQVDPSYAEARVRLARLLDERGRHDEAAAEIGRALATNPAPAVAFYAHLVAGRIDQARGQARRSLEHYTAAVALYPDAQSALLGASQAAAMTSDVAAAMSFVQHLGPRSQQFDADPWRLYPLAAGRDAEPLMRAMWADAAR
jgi:tetratricopeptide (TPR) repeat protein